MSTKSPEKLFIRFKNKKKTLNGMFDLKVVFTELEKKIIFEKNRKKYRCYDSENLFWA